MKYWCVTLFSQFPGPLTGTGPAALVRLTRQLVLQPVRDYLTSHHDQPLLGGQP